MRIKPFLFLCIFLLSFSITLCTANGTVPSLSVTSVMAQSVEDKKAEADRLLEQGMQQLEDNQFQIAIFYFKQALGIYREIKNRKGEAWSLGFLGSAYQDLSISATAVDYYNQSLVIAREIKDLTLESLIQKYLPLAEEQVGNNPQKAKADGLFQQGSEQQQSSQFEAALKSFQKALMIYQEIKNRLGELRVLGNLGLIYFDWGNYLKAIEYHQQSLAIAREIEARQEEANALGNLGNVYSLLGQYQKAIEYLQQSIAIAREIGYRYTEYRMLGNLGTIYQSRGQYEEAIEDHQQSLAVARESGDHQGEGIFLNNLGLTYYYLGQYQNAIDYLQQSLVIAREFGDRGLEAKSFGNLGLVYNSLGKYEKAIEYHQESLAIAQEIGDKQWEAGTLTNLGSVYKSLRRYQKAIEYHEHSLAIKREIRDKTGEGAALGNLGNAYFLDGQYQKAIEYRQQSLIIARDIGDKSAEANALGSLGVIYQSIGQYEKAIDYLKQYLAIAKEISDKKGEAYSLNNLGAVYNKLKVYSEAEKVLYNAIQAHESLRLNLADSDKVSIFEEQARSYYLLQTALIAKNKTNQALEISERGRSRAFVELLASKTTDNPKIQPITLTEIQQVAKAQNATLVEYFINPFENALYIWVINAQGNITFKSVDLKDTLLLDLVTTSRESLGVRGGRGGLVTVYKPSTNLQNNLKKLYSLLIEPIKDFLPTNPEERIIFIPHQELFFVTFAALQDNSGKYLIDNHTILFAPAIQVLQLTHNQTVGANGVRPEQALIVGNPTMPKIITTAGEETSEQLSPLPGAEREALEIATILNTKPIIGKNATKSNIFKQLPTAKIAHFATHGLLDDFKGLGVPGAIAFAPDPNNTEINNGLLTSSEILDLKLNIDLMVLSACDTGRGTLTGDGVIGLSRSLISSGVSSLIVSLWSVPDAPTAELMTEFYRQWQQNPDKAQALRQAMLKTKEKHPYPKDWAAFTLIGEAH